jgi:hypothetical protein
MILKVPKAAVLADEAKRRKARAKRKKKQP